MDIIQKQSHFQNHLNLTHHPYDMVNLNKRFSVVKATCTTWDCATSGGTVSGEISRNASVGRCTSSGGTTKPDWLRSFLSQVISNPEPNSDSYHVVCQMFNQIQSQSNSAIPDKIADLLKS